MARETGLSRLQSSVAVIDGGGRRYLVNASPDVNRQIELHLRGEKDRALRDPILDDVFLTNADLDHSLGLLLLREGGPFRVHAPEGARAALADGLRLDVVLNAFGGVAWIEAVPEWRALESLEILAVPLAGSTPPRFAPETGGVHAVGWIFRDPATGRQAGIFPDVAELNEELLEILATCNLLLFDGTFWRDDELGQLGISTRTARDMGHVPISGPDGSLAALERLRRTSCVYLHINNTNPILDAASVEAGEIEAAGLRVAEDGMKFHL